LRIAIISVLNELGQHQPLSFVVCLSPHPTKIPALSMASIAGAFTSPFRNVYRYMQRQAHENPVIFYSICVGCVGEPAAR
jgi:hypothetical protein